MTIDKPNTFICPRCHGEWDVDDNDALFRINGIKYRPTTACPYCMAKLALDSYDKIRRIVVCDMHPEVPRTLRRFGPSYTRFNFTLLEDPTHDHHPIVCC
jgi:hypothetical protein